MNITTAHEGCANCEAMRDAFGGAWLFGIAFTEIRDDINGCWARRIEEEP